MNQVEMMGKILLERLHEKGAAGFSSGRATDTIAHGHRMDDSERAMLQAWRNLVAAGQVTEQKTHFRTNGYYHSWYRLAGAVAPGGHMKGATNAALDVRLLD